MAYITNSRLLRCRNPWAMACMSVYSCVCVCVWTVETQRPRPRNFRCNKCSVFFLFVVVTTPCNIYIYMNHAYVYNDSVLLSSAITFGVRSKNWIVIRIQYVTKKRVYIYIEWTKKKLRSPAKPVLLIHIENDLLLNRIHQYHEHRHRHHHQRTNEPWFLHDDLVLLYCLKYG